MYLYFVLNSRHILYIGKEHYPLLGQCFFCAKSGEKIFEIRLNDEKRRLLKVGDCLFFKREQECNQELHTHIVELKHYKSFVDMLNEIPIGLIGFENMYNVDVLKEYHKFYTPEDEFKYGVVAIKVEVEE